MKHIIEEGLIYFTDEELKLIGEKRSPVDYRVTPFLAPIVEERAEACQRELSEIEVNTGIGTISNRPVIIEELRKKSGALVGLSVGLRTVADLVVLEHIQELRQ